MRYGEGRYTACDEHVAEALRSLDGAQAIEARGITGHDRSPGSTLYTCHCGKPGDWFLLEVVVE